MENFSAENPIIIEIKNELSLLGTTAPDDKVLRNKIIERIKKLLEEINSENIDGKIILTKL